MRGPRLMHRQEVTGVKCAQSQKCRRLCLWTGWEVEPLCFGMPVRAVRLGSHTKAQPPPSTQHRVSPDPNSEMATHFTPSSLVARAAANGQLVNAEGEALESDMDGASDKPLDYDTEVHSQLGRVGGTL